MRIKSKPPSKRTFVYESQARFLAGCITRLERAFQRHLGGSYNPDAGDAARFWALEESDVFHDAAYACNFVCNDLKPSYPIDMDVERLIEKLEREEFNGLRHYMHTLLRAERSNRMDGYFSPVCAAVDGGALGVVARRLASDESLYEAEK